MLIFFIHRIFQRNFSSNFAVARRHIAYSVSRVQLVFLINDHEAESVCSSTSSVTSPGESSSTARFSTSSATLPGESSSTARSSTSFATLNQSSFAVRRRLLFPIRRRGRWTPFARMPTLHEVAPSPTDLRSSTCHASMQTFGTLLELRDHLSFTISKGNF